MTKETRRKAFEEEEGDSPISSLIRSATERQARNQHDGRGRAGNAGEKGKDKRGASKATYYISTEAQEAIRELGEPAPTGEDCAQSDLVELAIWRFIKDYRAGLIDIEGMRVPARSLKVAWKLDLEELIQELS